MNLCLGDCDLGLAESNTSVGESQEMAVLTVGGDLMNLVSSVNGSEYPPASQGVLLRFGDRDSLVFLGGVLSGDGVGTTLDEAVLPPTADGVGVNSIESLLSSTLAVAAEFNNDVTSIFQTPQVPQAKARDSKEAYSYFGAAAVVQSRPGMIT